MDTVPRVRRLVLVLLVIIAGCAPAAENTTTTAPSSALRTTTSATSTTTTTLPPTTTTTTSTTTVPPTTTTTTTTLVPADGLTAADRTLSEVTTISGGIAPKSVVSSGSGLFFAQNMMYRHTVTVYDRDHELVATIPDSVTPSEFGHADFPGEYQGSPVEAAFTSDGRYGYVSNYRMYGGGLSTAASDGCNEGNWPDSFVYRIDTESLEIDQLLRVGSVPKFLAVTPDDTLLLVANWCGFDVSVLDLATGEELTRVPVGRHPRGIAISPDSSTAWVAVMGSRDIAVIDLETLDTERLEGVGRSPRHLVLSPDGGTLYATLNGEGRVVKLDPASGEVLGSVVTGDAPRSMTISDDGTALYVVNYFSNTMSKVRTADMVEVEEFGTWSKPIGITYDAPTREVWVSSYSGAIEVFVDTAP
jgi:YVTN family beta-propeller protein